MFSVCVIDHNYPAYLNLREELQLCLGCVCGHVRMHVCAHACVHMCVHACMCVLVCVCVCVCERSVSQSRPALCYLMDCSPPCSSVHGVFQARILEWVAISFSRGSFLTQGWSPQFLHLLHWQADPLPLTHQGSPMFSLDYSYFILL